MQVKEKIVYFAASSSKTFLCSFLLDGPMAPSPVTLKKVPQSYTEATDVMIISGVVEINHFPSIK